MGVTLITAPAEEPLTLAEARQQVKPASTEQDALIMGLIIGARRHAETFTRRRFITQTWDWVLDCFPRHELEVPCAPLQSVTSVSYVDTAGDTQALSASLYQVDVKNDPGRIAPVTGECWPSTEHATLNAVTVRFVCGYGLAAAVPREIKLALLLHVQAHFDQDEKMMQTMLDAADALLTPFRVLRF